MDKHQVMDLLGEPMNGLKINYTAAQMSSGTSATPTTVGYMQVGPISSTGQSGTYTTTTNGLTNTMWVSPQNLTAWDFWQQYYYPYVIRESYPMYIQERAMDKGQKSFEILKVLQDKKIVKFEKVGDFIDAMDALIKIV